MKQALKTFVKHPATLIAVGILIGAGALLAVRFITYSPEHTHYHANFAVYINGRREEFKSKQYYQEVSICNATSGITIPQQRAHMHDDINSLVHVHDHAVTWGQFFENIGWLVGPDLIETANGTKYIADGSDKLHIIINGQDYTDLTAITDTVIKDRDRLLVSFGNIDQPTLSKEFKSVPATAKHYDESKDPASCAAGEAVTTKQRLEHLF